MYTMIFHVKISLAGLLSENSRYKALQTSPPPGDDYSEPSY